MSRRRQRHRRSPYDPRQWPLWFLVGLLRLVVLLPFGAQLAVGRAFGRVIALTASRRVRIARRNIDQCFPELDAPARAQLLRDHLDSLGIMAIEVGLSWWGSAERIAPLARYEGYDNVERALARGKGVILLSAHFTSLEMGGRLLQLRGAFHPMYKPNHNPVIEYLMRSRRELHYGTLIKMDDVRALLRSLKDNVPVWYAPDQGFLGKGMMMVPFFGIPAPTNTATSRIARMSGAPVVPFFSHRLPGSQGYVLRFLPELEGFPGADVTTDALRINQLIEDEVRRTPAQYLWAHNRFKWRRTELADRI